MAPSATTHPSSSTDKAGGAKRPASIGWVFPSVLTMPLGNAVTVGRDESCDVVLAGSEISRRHAEFRVDGPVVALRDLDSRNGVFIDGRRIADAPLHLGSIVRCGEWIGIVATDAGTLVPFGEIAPGWFGGAALRAAIEPVRRVAADLSVVVQGATGTGKEGAARAIHDWSRRSGPLVAVNCATLPPDLVEAELFGYRRGAFTGADAKADGLFRAAEGGTLFLDEILDLPLALQPKLLRVLEERKVRPLGESRAIPIDVRVVAATQESLSKAVADGRFRADLRARLDGLTVVLPPLRARREDIVPLFLKFLDQHAVGGRPDVEPKLIESLCLHAWTANVRELLQLARRSLGLYGQERTLRKSHLVEWLSDGGSPSATEGASPARRTPRMRRKTDDQVDFEALVAALRAADGSVARAAEKIGMHRSRAYRLLDAHPSFSLDDVRR